MSNSTLNKFVLAPVLLSTTVFLILTSPLLLFGKKPVTVQLQEEPVFQGQLRDISTPYLCLATALSLGVGVASAAFTGWRNSSRKSSQVEAQLSILAQNIQAKEAEIEALKRSDSQLLEAKLTTFLLEDTAKESSNSQIGQTNFQPASTSPSLPSQQVEELNVQLQAIMAQMASVQAALSATNITESATKSSLND